jgi:Bacteriophage CII protein
MSAVLLDVPARARKNQAIVLQRLASVGLEPVAAYVGVDESTVSRWKGKEIPLLAKALARAGLKIVPVELRCYREAEIESLLTLARARLHNLENANALAEDDA